MLRRENELRLSPSVQALYRAEHDVKDERENGWITVTEELQREVAREFGIDPAVGASLMQRAEWIFVGETDAIIELSLYRKFNRMENGALNVGDVAPLDSAFVHPLLSHDATSAADGEQTASVGPAVAIRELMSSGGGRPLVVIAGSVS